MRALKKKDITTDLSEFVSDLIFEFKINRKKLPLINFLNEVRGFLASNGVTDETEADLLTREAIKQNHYAIENYLIEAYGGRPTIQESNNTISKTGRRPETIYGKDEYKDRLKKKFPKIKDRESLIMSAEEGGEEGEEMINEAPVSMVGEYDRPKPPIRTRKIPQEWLNALESVKQGRTPAEAMNKLKAQITNYAERDSDGDPIVAPYEQMPGLVACDDCPPVYANKWGCCYRRDKDLETNKPKNTCRKFCKVDPKD